MVARIRSAGGRVACIEASNEGHGMDPSLTLLCVGAAGMEFLQRGLARE